MRSGGVQTTRPAALTAANLIVQRDTVCASLFPRRVYLVLLCSPLRAAARFLSPPAQKRGGADRSNL
jgi:hypothetical protein